MQMQIVIPKHDLPKLQAEMIRVRKIRMELTNKLIFFIAICFQS